MNEQRIDAKIMIIDEQPYFRAGVQSALVKSGYREISESGPDSQLMDKIEDMANFNSIAHKKHMKIN